MRTVKLIKIRIHNYIDYALAVLLMASPWIFDMHVENMESKISITVGLSLLLTSLITENKFSLAKICSVQLHLKIDFFLGILLASSPWLYKFHTHVYLPHVIFAILILSNAAITKISPKKSKKTNLI